MPEFVQSNPLGILISFTPISTVNHEHSIRMYSVKPLHLTRRDLHYFVTHITCDLHYNISRSDPGPLRQDRWAICYFFGLL